VTDDFFLIHYGTPRKSGRYPWGSGGTENQKNKDFLARVADLERQGLSQKEISAFMNISIADLRAKRSIAKNMIRAADATHALELQQKGMSTSAIARQMGRNESSVRALLNPAMSERRQILENTVSVLKDRVDKGTGFLDVGKGNENELGISKTRLATAVTALREQGYVTHNVQVPQLGTSAGQKTTTLVLAKAGTTYGDVKRAQAEGKIETVRAYTVDKGRTYKEIGPPLPIDSKRVDVRWAEDGGGNADGVIYVRPGVPDVSLGGKMYAQVRVSVDGTHYLKGMAMYKDDLPPGVDLQYNVNKRNTGNKFDAMKSIKDDPEDPFGAATRPITYIGKDGKEHQGVHNKLNEEGDWENWSKTVSSQVLSKQTPALAKRQLDTTLKEKEEEFEAIKSLTNPVIKHKLLNTFADSADSSAVHLKAAHLPRQGTHVILPIENMNPNHIYAPRYRDGEKVVLIRYPHGGIFEIPELTVNNRNAKAKSVIGPNAPDAVGIHPKVARRLSGADFDGDFVLVIPNPRGDIATKAPLKGLKDFDPQFAYPHTKGQVELSPVDAHGNYISAKKAGRKKQILMGDVSNLLTDMTIKGANDDEIARAVRHSMVVIDAEKHGLDFKRSYDENGIRQLKEKYQGHIGETARLAGASTIISRAKAQKRIPEHRLRPAKRGGPIDPHTGEKVYERTGATYVDRKTGKTKVKLIRTTRLADTPDARTLISKPSGTPIEEIYAAHSNSLKALANRARLEASRTGKITYSPSAHRVYKDEVRKLDADLNLALKARPLERQAQIMGNSMANARLRDNPDADDEDRGRIKAQELTRARERIGIAISGKPLRKPRIEITDREWEAIQAGAITTNKLRQILDNSDIDKLKERAMPRKRDVMTPAKMALARARLASGFTQAEVADSLGIPVSTLNSAMKSEGG
jgi:DNA-binding CsgD family transcriptional regulator